ncbi:MAG: response regulator [bacterium]|nr:response regulator [bacterium]
MGEDKIRILLVDDDDIDCQAVDRYARRNNLPYIIRNASTEKEALQALDEDKFDIVLLDYDLRTATGLDLLPYTGDTPVVFVTGSGNEKIAVEAIRHGASDYLVKDPARNYLTVLPLTIANVLERRRGQKALLENEARFRALTEKVSDIVVILDKENCYTYVSPSVKLFGYSREELLGQNPRQLIHPDDWPYLKETLEQAIKSPGETINTDDLRIRHKDGSCRYLEGMLTCLYDQPGVEGVVFNGRDISERKHSEEERLKMEAHMRQVRKFESLTIMAGSIAHNFNNLLMGVLGNLELALSNLEEGSQTYQNVEKAERAARRVEDLTRMMLTYVGQAKGTMGVVNISGVINEMAGILEASVPKNTSLQFNIPATPLFFKGNRSQLRQVLLNLVSNASEALGEAEGTIAIYVGKLYCDSNCLNQPYLQEDLPGGDYIFLEITDSGCGMDEDTRVRAFDPFFTTRFKGRGMGLSAALGIVRAYKGTMTLESMPGAGTTVRILLPAVESPEEPKPVAREENRQWHNTGTILLADDEAMVLEVGQDMLEELGFKVLTAVDGHEAVEIFKKHCDEIVCVILDMIMPRLDGEQTFRQLRNLKSDIPVILCSGYTREQVAKRFFDRMPAPFIGKPFKLSGLAEKLQMVLSSKEPWAPTID